MLKEIITFWCMSKNETIDRYNNASLSKEMIHYKI